MTHERTDSTSDDQSGRRGSCHSDDEPLRLAHDVDAVGGPVAAPGALEVLGRVAEGARVSSRGALVVRGPVEGATVESDGDCDLEQGMAARVRGALWCGGRLRSSFLRSITARVTDDVDVPGEIVGCDLIVGGGLRCGGAVIGGRLAVTGSITAAALGSEREQSTLLVLGAVPTITAALSQIDQLIASLEPRRQELLERRHGPSLAGARMTAAQRELLTELDFALAALDGRLRALAERRAHLTGDALRRRTVDLRVAGRIHSGTRLRTGPREFTVERPVAGPVRIRWSDDRRLEFAVGDGPARPIALVAREIDLAA